MAFDDDVKITINLNKLVDTRARILTQYEDFSKAVVTGEYLDENDVDRIAVNFCLLYTSPSPRDRTRSRMPSSA